MAGKSASLLTKTQRQRLRNEFEGVDEDAKQRDQQLIRKRIRSGILDFQQLTDYPDSQYKLAFADVSEEELRSALADTYLAAERIRDLRRYDRAELLTEVQTRAEDVSAEATDVRSLEHLDLRTAAEVRRQTEERLGISRWEKHTMRLVKLTVSVAIVAYVSLLFFNPYPSGTGGEVGSGASGGGFALFPRMALLLGLISVIIVVVLAVRQDIIPALVTLAKQGREVWGTVWRRLGSERGWPGSDDDRTVRWKTGETRGKAAAFSTGDERESPLDRLRRRYAVGDLTEEEFERKLEQLLDTETREDAADHVNARE